MKVPSVLALSSLVALSHAAALGMLCSRLVLCPYSNDLPDKRQFHPTVSQKAIAVEEIKPVLNPSAKRVKLTYGPYKIKGKDVRIHRSVGIAFLM
jgi:hypothetical protein